MIVTAAFLACSSYEACHNDDYEPGESPVGVLIALAVFMWFDYQLALVIA